MQTNEFYSIGTFVAGVAIDHISTTIGLMTDTLIEQNPFVNWLISLRVWFLFDLFVLGVVSLVVTRIYRKWEHPSRWTVLIYPFLIGMVRLLAGLHNIALLYGAL
jgi:RsiW-degrading membrane proteinase PrsW (M82 family)